jgi:hypothetical protein
MTERTTAERIAEIIREGITLAYGSAYGITEIAQEIAAELDKAKAERDGYLSDVLFNQEWIDDMQRRADIVITQIAKERDDARAEVERLRKINLQVQEDYDNHILPLKAEIERLQLAAKAWNALVAWQRAEKNPNATENEVFPLLLAYEEAADAAGGW